MSKALGATADAVASSFAGQQQHRGSGGSNKAENASSRSGGYGMSIPGAAQKMPRSTHRNHRKPESSLNHLLNFSYARPASNTAAASPARRNNRSTPSYGRGSGYHPLDKAHFVNANFRFVVHPSGDYRPNMLEADVPVPWDNVLQVLASVQTQCDACPICLESVPIAPRMAKCGHIFCLPCALRYLASEDLKTGKSTSKWRKCPICFDGIYAKDLRPVKWCAGDDDLPVKGRDVTLQLIQRKAGSMFALPTEAASLVEHVVPWYNQDQVLEYARILRGDATYMIAEAERESVELVAMREQDQANFGDEGKWTATAIQDVEESAGVFHSFGNAPRPSKGSQPRVNRVDRRPVEYTVSEDGPEGFTRDNVPAPPAVPVRADKNDAQLESASGDAYYFYQPRTGSHYYLAPLDIRILKRAFSSFSSFPSALIAKVEHTTTVTVDEDIRRRTKYLSHLPLGCEVTFLECDWSGILEDEVIAVFKVDTDKRRKKRHDKAVSEESARRRAQALEERRERAGLGELQWQDETTSYFARNDDFNTYEVFADEQIRSGGEHSPERSNTTPHGSLERRSIWGTALPAQAEVVGSHDDDDAWKDQLEKFYEESAIAASTADANAAASGASPDKTMKKKSKKKKLVLMSSGGGRGMA